MTTTIDEYEKAMNIINDLGKEYLTWVQTDLKNLQNAYDKALQTPLQSRSPIMQNEVFKTAHDMKGQGATFGYDLITDIGNHLCRYIEKQTEFNTPQMEKVKTHIDALAEIINTHLTGDGGTRGQELKQTIEAIS